jgi:anti-anti-sigma factor
MTEDAAASWPATDGASPVTTVMRRLSADLVQVAMAGEIDVSTVEAFRRTLAQAATHRAGRLEVDLSGITFFACVGVEVVIGMRATCPGLVVVGASEPVRRLFTLAGTADTLR